VKHDVPGWTVTQDPDGTITWTTPTGHRYTSSPHDYRNDDDRFDGAAHTAYILEQAKRRSGPAPPPVPSLESPLPDDPPF
jgi:hypothetical protein